ncbi:MAG TPA: hypothetical protein VFX98_04130 [Longimicrobiaceae bacterium]|nr:hypothetical protein [Longimicrobiaceae bacterium]
MHRKLILPALLSAVAVAACENGPAGIAADEGMTRAEALALAPEYDLIAGDVLDGFGFASFSVSGEGGFAAAAVSHEVDFTRTRTCPAGGSTTITGTHTASGDREARSGTFHTEATRTDAACALRRPGGEVVMTITGNPNIVLTADWSVTNGVPGKRTATHKGGFSWSRSTGQSGVCSVDLTSTWDPATRTHTVKGTFCNHTVDVTHTRGG